MSRKKYLQYDIPNPKTGEVVRVFFRRMNAAKDEEWEADASVASRRAAGLFTVATATLFLRRGKWGYLDTPESHPRGRGYGLCLYLASALAAGARGSYGLAPGALSEDSFRMWHALWQHGVAEGDEPQDVNAVLARESDDYPEYEAPVVLPAENVRRLLARARRRR